MSELLSDRGVFICADEATYNTDAVGADFTANNDVTYLAVHDDIDIVLNPEFYVPPVLRPSIAGNSHVVFDGHAALTGTMPMRAWESGASGEERPFYFPFLQAANLKESISSGTSATYSLETANDESLSGYLYLRNAESDKWRLAYVTGARGNLNFQWNINAEPTISFNLLSPSSNDWTDDEEYFDSNDEPALDKAGSSLTYTGDAARDSASKLKCQGVTLQVGGTDYPVQSGNLDLGITPIPKNLMTSSQTVAKVLNSIGQGSRSNGQLLLVDGEAAYDDVRAKWAAGTEAAFSAVFANDDDKVTIAADLIQLGYYSRSNQGGIQGWSIPFFVNLSDNAPFGEGSITITYEAA